MRHFVTAAALAALTMPAAAQVHVDGYTRNDGTYVRPHERTSPDSSVTNNYSYSPGRSRSYDSDFAPSRSTPSSQPYGGGRRMP